MVDLQIPPAHPHEHPQESPVLQQLAHRPQILLENEKPEDVQEIDKKVALAVLENLEESVGERGGVFFGGLGHDQFLGDDRALAVRAPEALAATLLREKEGLEFGALEAQQQHQVVVSDSVEVQRELIFGGFEDVQFSGGDNF